MIDINVITKGLSYIATFGAGAIVGVIIICIVLVGHDK